MVETLVYDPGTPGQGHRLPCARHREVPHSVRAPRRAALCQQTEDTAGSFEFAPRHTKALAVRQGVWGLRGLRGLCPCPAPALCERGTARCRAGSQNKSHNWRNSITPFIRSVARLRLPLPHGRIRTQVSGTPVEPDRGGRSFSCAGQVRPGGALGIGPGSRSQTHKVDST